MRGSLKQRYKGSWSIILDLGNQLDPVTGKEKRKQKWVTFKSTPGLSRKEQKKEAVSKLNELVAKVERHEDFVEPTKVTLGNWLRTWLAKSVEPMRRPGTYRVYKTIIEKHIATSPLGSMLLPKLRGSDLERYYANLKDAAPATVKVHHAILHRALRKAVKDGLLTTNPAVDLDRPKATTDVSASTRANCWTADQARAFLSAADAAGAQVSAFFALALDTGARKSELYGLAWGNVDLDHAVLTIERQLDAAGVAPLFEPVFGPTKTKRTRTVSLSAETVSRLRAHKRQQAALRMRNRTTYQDFGLLFAKEPPHVVGKPNAKLGQPLTTFDSVQFAQLIVAANVPRIKFHGLRHTSASLLIAAGVSMPVVAERLGHTKVSMTADVYAHVLPQQQQHAAAMLGALLHG